MNNIAKNHTDENKWKECDIPPEVISKSHQNLLPKEFPIFFSVNRNTVSTAMNQKDENIETLEDESNKITNFFPLLKTEESKILEESKFLEEFSSIEKSQKIEDLFSNNHKHNSNTNNQHHKSGNYNISSYKSHQWETMTPNNFFKSVMKYYLVRKFVNSLKNSIYFRFHSPKKQVLRLINDKSFFSLKGEKNCLLNKFLNWLCKFKILSFFNMKIKPIEPNSSYLIILHIIQTLLMMVYFIIIPLNIATNSDVLEALFGNFKANAFKKTIFSLFLLDIVVSLFVIYIDKRGEVIGDINAIMKKYTKNKFLKDLFSLLYIFFNCFNIEISIYIQIFSAALYLMRISSFNTKMKKIINFFSFSVKTMNFLSFLILIVNILLIVHIFACFWLFCGNCANENDITWLESSGLRNNHLINQYLASVYYIVLIISNTGFSNIYPQTDYEKLFTIIIVFVTFGLLALYLDHIIMISRNVNHEKRIILDKMRKLERFLTEKNIDYLTKAKIKKYLKNIYKEEEKIKDFDETEITKKHGMKLNTGFFENMLNLIVNYNPFLSKYFSNEFLKKLLLNMEKSYFYPEQIISLKNKSEDLKLYFIEKGEVDIYEEKPNKISRTVIQTLKTGEIFGQNSFFSGFPANYSVKASKFTSIYSITKDSFLKILKENLQDYESYCFLKHSINFCNEPCDLKCKICKSIKHNLLNCPYSHLVLSKLEIIEKEEFLKQTRSTYKRKPQKRLNSRKNFTHIKNAAGNKFYDFSSNEIYTGNSSSSELSEDEILRRIGMDASDPLSENLTKLITNTNSEAQSKLLERNNNEPYLFDTSDTSLGREIKARRLKKLKSNSAIALNRNNGNLRDLRKIKDSKNKLNDYPKSIVLKKNSLATSNLSSIFEEEEELDECSLNSKNDKYNQTIKLNKDNFTSSTLVVIEEILLDSVKEYKYFFKNNNISMVIKEFKNKQTSLKRKKIDKILFPSIEKHNKIKKNEFIPRFKIKTQLTPPSNSLF